MGCSEPQWASWASVGCWSPGESLIPQSCFSAMGWLQCNMSLRTQYVSGGAQSLLGRTSLLIAAHNLLFINEFSTFQESYLKLHDILHRHHFLFNAWDSSHLQFLWLKSFYSFYLLLSHKLYLSNYWYLCSTKKPANNFKQSFIA